MKKMLLVLITLLVLSGCSAVNQNLLSDNSSEEIYINDDMEVSDIQSYEVFFEDNEIHEINITITEEDWDDMMNNPIEEIFHPASIVLDGIEVENVGIRTKGNSTLNQVARSDSERYSFKIKINKYEDQEILGLDEFVLNNMFSDASYLREYFSYESMESIGEIVPLSSFVNVIVNDELIGFYLLVETIDDSFLERNFGNNDGNLYRADSGTTLLVDGSSYKENVKQKNGKDTSKEDLYNLLDILNDMETGEKGDIETVLDVDSVLRYIAGNTLLENYDSLNGNFSQNYYLYNNDGIFTLIPWDYNMSFGGFGGGGLSTIDIDEPVSGIKIENSPLINNLLAVDEYKTRYYGFLNDYISYFDDFENQVLEISDLIRPYVELDPSKFSTMEFFESSVVYEEGGAYESEAMMGNRDGMTMPGNISREDGTPPGDRSRENGMPPGDMNGENGMPPGDMDGENDMPWNDMNKEDGDNFRKGGGLGFGGNMGGDGISIVNILYARIENIKSQLSE